MYCSLGIRSETIGIKLKKPDIPNVKIFMVVFLNGKINDFPMCINQKKKKLKSPCLFQRLGANGLKTGPKFMINNIEDEFMELLAPKKPMMTMKQFSTFIFQLQKMPLLFLQETQN